MSVFVHLHYVGVDGITSLQNKDYTVFTVCSAHRKQQGHCITGKIKKILYLLKMFLASKKGIQMQDPHPINGNLQ